MKIFKRILTLPESCVSVPTAKYDQKIYPNDFIEFNSTTLLPGHPSHALKFREQKDRVETFWIVMIPQLHYTVYTCLLKMIWQLRKYLLTNILSKIKGKDAK